MGMPDGVAVDGLFILLAGFLVSCVFVGVRPPLIPKRENVALGLGAGDFAVEGFCTVGVFSLIAAPPNRGRDALRFDLPC